MTCQEVQAGGGVSRGLPSLVTESTEMILKALSGPSAARTGQKATAAFLQPAKPCLSARPALSHVGALTFARWWGSPRQELSILWLRKATSVSKGLSLQFSDNWMMARSTPRPHAHQDGFGGGWNPGCTCSPASPLRQAPTRCQHFPGLCA